METTTSIFSTMAVSGYNFSGQNRADDLGASMKTLVQSLIDQGFVTSMGTLELFNLPESVNVQSCFDNLLTAYNDVDKNIINAQVDGKSVGITKDDWKITCDNFLTAKRQVRAIKGGILTGNRRYRAILLAVTILRKAGKEYRQLVDIPMRQHGDMSTLEITEYNIRENSLRLTGGLGLDSVSLLTAITDYHRQLLDTEGEHLTEARAMKTLGLKRGTCQKIFGIHRINQSFPELNILDMVKKGDIKLTAIGQQEPRKIHKDLTDDYDKNLSDCMERLTDPKKENAKKMADRKKLVDAAKDMSLPEEVRQLIESVLGGNETFVVYCQGQRKIEDERLQQLVA